MTNCFKKHWFLIIGILLLSNYSFGQTFLSILDLPEKPNGRPFIVRLNPISSIAQECTSQTIILNIGKLMYLPGSNGPVPAGIVITPVISNDETTLTISGILNDGKQGTSLLMDIAVQFKPGTCDGVSQVITATTKNVGCLVPSDQSGSLSVISKTPNNLQINLQNRTSGQPYCPKRIIKYTVSATNYGNMGFNLSELKFNLELDKCVRVLDVYKYGTYESVNPNITSGNDKVTVNFSMPDLLLSVNYEQHTFDLYFEYPCLTGTASDCVEGTKFLRAYVTGNKKGCEIPFTTEDNKQSSAYSISSNLQTCPGAACGSGTGDIGKIEKLSTGFSFDCPDKCLGSDAQYSYFGFSTPPNFPAYTNRKIIIDIPLGINVLGVSNYVGVPPCGAYQIRYIDAQGNKQATPFAGSLTKQIELTTDCTVSSPEAWFWISFNYNEVNTPLPGSKLTFSYKYFAENTLLIQETFGTTIDYCNPRLSMTKQVRKASQKAFENNYNASAVPGELMTYRYEVYNFGTADVNNTIIDKLDDNLIYEGGFKYAFVQNLYDDSLYTSLAGRDSFEYSDLGKVSVSVPTIGQSGTINLSGFNFPCSMRKRLYIEYNVRVKNNVIAETKITDAPRLSGSAPSSSYNIPISTVITIAAFTYVKSKMLVKCSMANEWNESGINVKNGEVVDLKMQFSNAGSTPIVLSELINLRPQNGDLFEFGSNARNSTLSINYNCDNPSVLLNNTAIPSVIFNYALNSPTMDRNMLCPEQSSGNLPIWTNSCDSANWLKASFPNNFTLLPGDYVDVIYKGRVTGTVGTAYNSFAFKVGGCKVLSTNSNTLAIANDNVGVGCNSCTLTNPYSSDMKTLFESLMKNILTRKINGETDVQINGSSPIELLALRPYISNGGGEKIYNFVSTVNAQNKITSVKFSFTASSPNDVTFLEEKGLDYNPEVGFIDPSYLRIDTTLYSSSDQYLTTCRRTLDNNGTVISECNSKTQVRNIDFCPSRFCSPMSGEIKIGD